MEYFTRPGSAAEAKAQYRALVREHHPDRGGCGETMQAINAEYERVLAGFGVGSAAVKAEMEDALREFFKMMDELFRPEPISEEVITLRVRGWVADKWDWRLDHTDNIYCFRSQSMRSFV